MAAYAVALDGAQALRLPHLFSGGRQLLAVGPVVYLVAAYGWVPQAVGQQQLGGGAGAMNVG
jgi:hypothetical protein